MAVNFFKFFLDLIFPIECLNCGKSNFWLCDDCFKTIKIRDSQLCFVCGKENLFGKTCAECQDKTYLNGVFCAGNYSDKLLSQVIHAFKYSFVKNLAENLAGFIILAFSNELKKARLLDEEKNFHDFIVVPVPLSKMRKRWRGFNQAEELAKTLANKKGLEVNNNILVRIKNKKSQASLKPEKRLKNIEGIFTAKNENLNCKKYILIDDVITTGATMNECAKILKEAGADEVWGFVIAGRVTK